MPRPFQSTTDKGLIRPPRFLETASQIDAESKCHLATTPIKYMPRFHAGKLLHSQTFFQCFLK